MTTHKPPHVEHKPVPHLIDKGHIPTHPVVLKEVVTTTMATTVAANPHPSVFQPWTQLAAQAEAEFKGVMAAALRVYQAEFTAAGKILETAQAMSAEQAGTLQAAAWAAWNRYMEQADATAAAIMGPALAGYDRAIAAASDAYQKALTDAEKTYKAVMADVNRATADAKGFPAAS